MTTPIADFVKKYVDSRSSRFHMPGHKGQGFLGCEAFDITEIDGADVLGCADGIIAESEKNAAALFKSKYSFYSTEGSTLCIKAMLAIIKKKNGNATRIYAARNVHKAFIYACALLDITPTWLYSENASHLCACQISPKALEKRLSAEETLPDAVYITSPDYLGNIADVEELAQVCHRFGLPLLVDNAHGAYLAFLEPSLHPLALGADMCCDSAHKTLPVLTGGAYLHIGKDFDISESEVRNALSLFASTSPSYLTLQSLDMCNDYLCQGYTQRLASCIENIERLKNDLKHIGITADTTDEPLKIVFSRQVSGISGYKLAQRLRAFGAEPEFYDKDSLVLMMTPELDATDLKKVLDALSGANIPRSCYQAPPSPAKLKQVCSIREAILSPSEIVDVKKAIGRVCATPTVSCPPAVPIAISGELIDSHTAEIFSYYGIEKIEVMK